MTIRKRTVAVIFAGLVALALAGSVVHAFHALRDLPRAPLALGVGSAVAIAWLALADLWWAYVPLVSAIALLAPLVWMASSQPRTRPAHG